MPVMYQSINRYFIHVIPNSPNHPRKHYKHHDKEEKLSSVTYPRSCCSAKSKLQFRSLWGTLWILHPCLLRTVPSRKWYIKRSLKKHHLEKHCYLYVKNTISIFHLVIEVFIPQRRILGTSSGRWRGWDSASTSTFPLSFYLALEFF